jgi:phage anti-repressor protein/prophage antirepressor-like protein
MIDKTCTLPLPPMVFRDVHFEVVYVDEEPCLRADQIGQALQLDPPESRVLELYQAHRGHFSDFITRVVAVPLEGGARPMRVFTLWGTLSLAKRGGTPEAQDFEVWVTELMMIRGYNLQWEIIRLHGENADLWGRLVETEAKYRQVSKQLQELNAELMARSREETSHLEGEFQRLSDEQRAGFAALAEWITERLENPPSHDTGLRPLFGSLLKAVEGLFERLEKLESADGKLERDARENVSSEPRHREEEEREPPFDPARATIASVGPFTVYAATLRGYDCRLINGRELWTCLESKQQFSTWMKDRIAWYGFRECVDYVLIHDYGNFNRKDYFLRLNAALDLVWFDRSPRAGEVHDGLVAVARQTRGNIIEGEAVRVGEGSVLPAVPTFPEEGLVTVIMGEIGGKSHPICNGRDLHQFLEVGRDFSTWIKDRIAEYGFIDGEDYGTTEILSSPKSRSSKARPQRMIEYHLTLEMAKELAMVENNEQGRKVRRYFIKCEKMVLAWHEQVVTIANTRLASANILPGTPPHEPLVFRFHDGKKAVRIRVAVEGGRLWFLLKDLGAAMNMHWGEARGTFASMPAELRRLLPSLAGERTEPALSEAGLWFFLGNWRGLSNAGLLRTWMIDDVFPALDARSTAPASESMPALPPLPPEVHYTHRDPLQMTFVALADALLRTEGHPFHTAPMNHGRILAWLWRNAPAGNWLDVRNRTRFAAAVGIDRRTVARVLARAMGWGLVEQSPAPEPELPEAWPTRIRLRRDRVRASLHAAGLDLPE